MGGGFVAGVPVAALVRWVAAVAIAGAAASRGLRKKSLSRSGAAAAFGVGLLALGVSWT